MATDTEEWQSESHDDEGWPMEPDDAANPDGWPEEDEAEAVLAAWHDAKAKMSAQKRSRGFNSGQSSYGRGFHGSKGKGQGKGSKTANYP
eukprot:5272452-Amphidinium_carterae.1